MPTPADLNGGYVHVHGPYGRRHAAAPSPTVAIIAEAMSDNGQGSIYVAHPRPNGSNVARGRGVRIAVGRERRDFREYPISIGDEIICDEHTACAVHFHIGGSYIVPKGHAAKIVDERIVRIERSGLEAAAKRLHDFEYWAPEQTLHKMWIQPGGGSDGIKG